MGAAVAQNLDINAWLRSGTIIASGNKKVLIGWGDRYWRSMPSENPLQPSFYFPDFFLKDEKPWFTQEHTLEIENEKLMELLPHVQLPYRFRWDSPNKEAFTSMFEEIKHCIYAKKLEKAVPFSKDISRFIPNEAQLVASLQSLLKYSLKTPAFVYGFWTNEEGMLGASPETLFRFIDSKRIETVVCAGTTKDSDSKSNLIQDPKQLHEHRVVVETVVEALSSYGTVHVGELKIQKFPPLSHLVTLVQVDLKEKTPFQTIVKVLHPTPAVGAFPLEYGAEWLQKIQEKVDRRRYGAPVGYLIPARNKADCYVAIRNIQWEKSCAYIMAGCGVVHGSVLEGEWNEINMKLNAIKEMLVL